MIPTIEALMAFAKSIECEQLITEQRRRPFSVSVVGDHLEFIPKSSGKPRPEPPKQLKAIVDRIRSSGSLKISDYSHESRNASYVLALVRLWEKRQ